MRCKEGGMGEGKGEKKRQVSVGHKAHSSKEVNGS